MNTKKVIGGSIGAIITLFIAQILAHIIESLLLELNVPEGICNIFKGLLYLFFAYIFLKVLAKKFLKLELESLFIPKFYVKIKWFVIGILLPVVVILIFLLFPGEFVSSEMNGIQIFTTISATIFFSGIAAGFVEEMIFRGFILNLFMKRWNLTIAIVVSSVLFGALHIIGMKFSLLNFILVLVAGTIAGIMFSLIALENKSVWNSGIVHCLWNIVGSIIAVSDTPNDYSIVTYVLESKHVAITGGEFGIESSIITICCFLILILFTILMLKRKVKIRNFKI